jgi:hypothetical protein
VAESQPPDRPEFDPTLRHVASVVDKVETEQVFSEYIDFPCQFAFHQLFHVH